MNQMPYQLEYFIEPEDLENLLREKHHEVAKRISEFLIWAMENNADAFVFADILLDDGERLDSIQLGCERKDYLEAFEKQLKNMIELEEFEICPKLKEWIDYLKIEEKVKG
tara:strand:- start:172 stop:504 length:333 start_codon:yes stop_codon:yes gene_type:complete